MVQLALAAMEVQLLVWVKLLPVTPLRVTAETVMAEEPLFMSVMGSGVDTDAVRVGGKLRNEAERAELEGAVTPVTESGTKTTEFPL